MPHTITIESAALPVEHPSSVADLCELVKRTRTAKHGLYPVGGRTTLDIGLTPAKPGVACDTTSLAKVIDYPARDMTITAQAGVTVAALQAELAKAAKEQAAREKAAKEKAAKDKAAKDKAAKEKAAKDKADQKEGDRG